MPASNPATWRRVKAISATGVIVGTAQMVPAIDLMRDTIRARGFNFDLVSDVDQTLCTTFGVIKEKNMYGRKVLGIERSTFLIDPEGVIRHAWRPVKVPGHAQAVLDALKAAS